MSSLEALARRLRREATRRDRIAAHKTAMTTERVKYRGRKTRLKLTG